MALLPLLCIGLISHFLTLLLCHSLSRRYVPTVSSFAPLASRCWSLLLIASGHCWGGSPSSPCLHLSLLSAVLIQSGLISHHWEPRNILRFLPGTSSLHGGASVCSSLLLHFSSELRSLNPAHTWHPFCWQLQLARLSRSGEWYSERRIDFKSGPLCSTTHCLHWARHVGVASLQPAAPCTPPHPPPPPRPPQVSRSTWEQLVAVPTGLMEMGEIWRV